MRIAVLEVDVAQAGRIKATCEKAGLGCTLFHSSRALLQAEPASHFHAVVMGRGDTGLPPHEMVMWLRRGVGIALPIALIGAMDDDAAVAAYYDAGADICLRHSFSAGELGARLAALRRRVAPDPGEPFDLTHAAFRFATRDRRVWVGGQPVQLAPKEFDLSVLLFRNLGELVLRETMLRQIWRRELHPNSRTATCRASAPSWHCGRTMACGCRRSTGWGAGWTRPEHSFQKTACRLSPLSRERERGWG